MLPLYRKEKLDDIKHRSFPYRYVKPAMLGIPRRRRTLRLIHIFGLSTLLLLLWMMLSGNDKRNRYKSPYARISPHYNDSWPIKDVTIQECTRWAWFQSRSRCTKLLENGWEISGGDLLLDTGKNRVHLFIKREKNFHESTSVIEDLQISREKPSKHDFWQGRPGGIWIRRGIVYDIKDAVTSIDFIHGRGVPELRTDRQYVPGGPLHLGNNINLSFRKGLPPSRTFPRLKVRDGRAYKVLQVAGTTAL